MHTQKNGNKNIDCNFEPWTTGIFSKWKRYRCEFHIIEIVVICRPFSGKWWWIKIVVCCWLCIIRWKLFQLVISKWTNENEKKKQLNNVRNQKGFQQKLSHKVLWNKYIIIIIINNEIWESDYYYLLNDWLKSIDLHPCSWFIILIFKIFNVQHATGKPSTTLNSIRKSYY